MTEPTRRSRVRLRWQPRQVLFLTVVWLVLVGHLNLVTVVGGILIAVGVTVVFPLPPIEWAGRLHPLGVLRLAAHLVKDLAVASVRLAAYAFSSKLPTPGVIRVHLRSDSDLYEVNTAELVSVVPGTIVVDARRRSRLLYLHVFDLPDPAERTEVIDDTHALERRILHAFGSAEEMAELDRRRPEATPEFEDAP